MSKSQTHQTPKLPLKSDIRGIKQGGDCDALKTQIAAYINYAEATCNHAHFATEFLVSVQILAE
jgi:hypothetical protein